MDLQLFVKKEDFYGPGNIDALESSTYSIQGIAMRCNSILLITMTLHNVFAQRSVGGSTM